MVQFQPLTITSEVKPSCIRHVRFKGFWPCDGECENECVQLSESTFFRRGKNIQRRGCVAAWGNCFVNVGHEQFLISANKSVRRIGGEIICYVLLLCSVRIMDKLA